MGAEWPPRTADAVGPSGWIETRGSQHWLSKILSAQAAPKPTKSETAGCGAGIRVVFRPPGDSNERLSLGPPCQGPLSQHGSSPKPTPGFVGRWVSVLWAKAPPHLAFGDIEKSTSVSITPRAVLEGPQALVFLDSDLG